MAPAVLETRIPGHLAALSILRWREPVETVRPLLLVMPFLRTLELGFWYPADRSYTHGGEQSLDLHALDDCLRPFRETLVHLALRFDWYDIMEEEAYTGTLEDMVYGDSSFLRHFTALITLKTSLGLLFGEAAWVPAYTGEADDVDVILADVLPPNLRKLILTHHQPRHDVFSRSYTNGAARSHR